MASEAALICFCHLKIPEIKWAAWSNSMGMAARGWLALLLSGKTVCTSPQTEREKKGVVVLAPGQQAGYSTPRRQGPGDSHNPIQGLVLSDPKPSTMACLFKVPSPHNTVMDWEPGLYHMGLWDTEHSKGLSAYLQIAVFPKSPHMLSQCIHMWRLHVPLRGINISDTGKLPPKDSDSFWYRCHVWVGLQGGAWG